MTPDELRAWMDTHGWTAARLARSLGVHPVTLRKWLAGMQPIRHPEMVRLALAKLEATPPAQ